MFSLFVLEYHQFVQNNEAPQLVNHTVLPPCMIHVYVRYRFTVLLLPDIGQQCMQGIFCSGKGIYLILSCVFCKFP